MYKEALWWSTGGPTNVTLLCFGACVLYSSDLYYEDEYENKSAQS